MLLFLFLLYPTLKKLWRVPSYFVWVYPQILSFVLLEFSHTFLWWFVFQYHFIESDILDFQISIAIISVSALESWSRPWGHRFDFDIALLFILLLFEATRLSLARLHPLLFLPVRLPVCIWGIRLLRMSIRSWWHIFCREVLCKSNPDSRVCYLL